MTERRKPPHGKRFGAAAIWNAHLKGLRNRDYATDDRWGVADVAARTILWGVPVGLGAASYLLHVSVAAVDGLIAGAGLLAGALFMAFTQIASWRDRYSARQETREIAERPDRYSLDEAVAHVLVATYACFLLVVVAIVGANFADPVTGALEGVWAAAVVLVGVYLLLLMMMVMPRLYSAYATTHALDDEISGLHR